MEQDDKINFEEIIISDQETEMLAEYNADLAAEKVFMDHMSSKSKNNLARLEKRRAKHWRHLRQTYKLDPNKNYVAEYSELLGRTVIKEIIE